MNKEYLKGFTLVELSIVLVIIGLLISGITAGSSLIKNARIKNTIIDLKKYETAYNTFRMQYNAIAGDMKNANSYWSGIGNGDGNSFITNSPNWENYFFWRHLNRAGLIPGSYSGTAAAQAGINHPASHFGVFAAISDSVFQGRIRNAISIANPSNDCGWCNASMTPIDAKKLDMKIDDGVANLGLLQSIDGGNISGYCSAAWNSTGADYKNNNTIACRLFFFVQ